MAAVFSGFSVWVLITVVFLCLMRGNLGKKTKLRLAECGMGVKMEQDAEYENTRNFNGGIRDENTLSGAGYNAHFDRHHVG